MNEMATFNAFIKSWGDKKVICYIVEENSIREFDRNPLFVRHRLFKGKQILFETTVEPGTATIVCKEVQLSESQQLWNFYLFKLKQIFKI